MRHFFYTFGILITVFLCPAVANAAVLHFEVVDQVGAQYVVEVRVKGVADSNGIEFDLQATDNGRIVSLSKTDRIITFWADGPEIKDGLSRLQGAGISLAPLQNETILELQVEPGARGSYLTAVSARAATRDGSGTLVELEARPLFLPVLGPASGDVALDTEQDITPPEMSTPVWVDGGLAGESFWSLTARDPESGLYGYYIIEGRHEAFIRQPFYQPQSRWPHITSITAYDNTGNSTTIKVVRPGWWCGDRYCAVLLPLVYLAVALLAWVLIFLIRVRTSFGTTFFRFTWRGAMRRFVAWHCAFKRVCRIPRNQDESNDDTSG